jgi:hypothetical protein
VRPSAIAKRTLIVLALALAVLTGGRAAQSSAHAGCALPNGAGIGIVGTKPGQRSATPCVGVLLGSGPGAITVVLKGVRANLTQIDLVAVVTGSQGSGPAPSARATIRRTGGTWSAVGSLAAFRNLVTKTTQESTYAPGLGVAVVLVLTPPVQSHGIGCCLVGTLVPAT